MRAKHRFVPGHGTCAEILVAAHHPDPISSVSVVGSPGLRKLKVTQLSNVTAMLAQFFSFQSPDNSFSYTRGNSLLYLFTGTSE